MSLFKLCTDSPIPDLEDLKKQVNDQIDNIQEEYEDFKEFITTLSNQVKTPIIPTLQEYIYEGYSSVMEEINEFIEGLKNYQDMLSQFNILKVLADVIGGAIEDLIPKIPIINISIIDILSGNIKSLYDAVKQMILEQIEIPFVPLPLYETISNYTKEVVASVKMILTAYKNMLTTAITDMIKQVLDILEISAILPLLFTIPTVEELKELLLALFPDVSSIYELIKKYDIDYIMDMLKNILPFPIPNFTPPMTKFFSSLEEELNQKLNQIADFAGSLNMKMLIDFIKDNLSMLGIEFPTICIEF